jgi:hypothetical protein
MQKDGSDPLPTWPPPAAGDAYAAETVVGRAPVDVLAMLKSPATESTFAADSIDTVVLAPRSGVRAAAPVPDVVPADSAVTPGPIVSSDSASNVTGGSTVTSWIFPAVLTAVICALMFLLGRLL